VDMNVDIRGYERGYERGYDGATTLGSTDSCFADIRGQFLTDLRP
jgi:hypothetical protein